MVSTQLHHRTTRYAPLLCWVLAMGGADASDFTDSCFPWAPKRVSVGTGLGMSWACSFNSLCSPPLAAGSSQTAQ